MLKILLLFLLSIPIQAADLYKISLYSMAGASALDITSSWNKPESNILLGHGPFRYRQLAVKSGTTFVILYGQNKITYNKRKPRKIAAILNFVASGLLVGVAVNNWR